MKQQIIVIGGGNSYESYDAYLSALKHKTLTLDYIRAGQSWKGTLQETLGDGYDVLAPRFPLRDNARYSEWSLYFEKVLDLVDDGVMVLGHSLGGIFLAKYLSEHTSSKTIRAVFLIAAPYAIEESPYATEFNVHDLTQLREQVSHIFLYHSADDMVVPLTELERYTHQLPNATVRTFTDRGHFNGEAFPEIIEDIKSV